MLGLDDSEDMTDEDVQDDEEEDENDEGYKTESEKSGDSWCKEGFIKKSYKIKNQVKNWLSNKK